MNEWGAFIVMGSGEAAAPQPSLFTAQIRSTVRYADPSAWIVAAAVAHALKGWTDFSAASSHQTGMIVVSDDGPRATMAEVESQGALGFSSPLRYAASSPGSLAGVSCIAFGLRGPTLNLTLPPQEGLPVALALSAAWLARKEARAMVLATFNGVTAVSSGRALLLAAAESSGRLLTDSLIDWLRGDLLFDRSSG